ncbi:hypothetical protein FHS78_003657 [Parvibaculum indicum]|uniref:hypothetical protein n=1 Tax=Parvibaculum indicum TaxID=562969 RepID=UPI001422E065|nr:hypothetical protein [Parvibaculum indicum]NIJ43343.1 hypothetical protein [Parvibaculum indicum]
MGSSLDNKCFILGVGAQKAGTSWLHDYLERRPEVFMPSPWKELHYFDARYCPISMPDIAPISARISTMFIATWRQPG